MINEKYNQKYLKSIREEFNRKINFKEKYAAYVNKTAKTVFSSGALDNSFYGLYEPHEDLKMLFDHTRLGTVTTDGKNIDFKYYLDRDGNVLMTERYDPTSQYPDKLVNTIFVEYKKRQVNAIFCKGKTGNISTIAQCKLDLFDRLIRYVECTVGVDEYPYVYSVTRFKRALGRVKIKRSVYSIWQEGDKTLLSEKEYVYAFGKLREKANHN